MRNDPDGVRPAETHLVAQDLPRWSEQAQPLVTPIRALRDLLLSEAAAEKSPPGTEMMPRIGGSGAARLSASVSDGSSTVDTQCRNGRHRRESGRPRVR
jgi:hypothetical protein